MAEFLGVPLRTYQKIETGSFPMPATMEAITQRLGVSELAMVQAPGEVPPKPAREPTNSELLEEIRGLRASLPWGNHPRAALIAEMTAALATLDNLQLEDAATWLENVTGRKLASRLSHQANQPRNKRV
jgi:transcriptional regulator with XRE-family HTH domain